MTENALAIIVTGVQSKWGSTSMPESTNILPTDDQLIQLVDSLCDLNFSSELKPENDVSSGLQGMIDCENSGSPKQNGKDFGNAYTSGTTSSENPILSNNTINIQASVSMSKKPSELLSEMELAKFPREKREFSGKSNTEIKHKRHKRYAPPPTCLHYTSQMHINIRPHNLNISMARCRMSLECLTEKRKKLEAQLRLQNDIKIVTHAFSNTSRLPDAPTKVDRLIHDVNQERYRVLEIVAALDKTINTFATTTIKNDLRQVLAKYGGSIVDVLKERQIEVNATRYGNVSDSSNHVTKLAFLIDRVNYLTRTTDAALWCVNVRYQVLTVQSRKLFTQSSSSPTNAPVVCTNAEIPQTAPINSFKGSVYVSPPKISNLEQWQHPLKLILPKKVVGMSRGYGGGGLQRKPRGGQCLTISVGQPQTNAHRLSETTSAPPPSKLKKSSSFQLFAQQQRAEIFQRYSSVLKNPCNDSGKIE